MALHTIDVHRNPLTIEVLREVPEFTIFDERRKAKYSKQVQISAVSVIFRLGEGWLLNGSPMVLLAVLNSSQVCDLYMSTIHAH